MSDEKPLIGRDQVRARWLAGAECNVVRLPTASKKRVKGGGVMVTSRALATGAATRHPAQYVSPRDRSERARLSQFREDMPQQSAELLLLMGVLSALKPRARARVEETLQAIAASGGSPHARKALTIVALISHAAPLIKESRPD